MRDLTTSNFGLLVAFLIPGFTVCIGLSSHSERLTEWMSVSGSAAPSIGGFLYATLASTAAGMTVSAVRWLFIDWIHHNTGVPPPSLSFSSLPRAVAALDTLVEGHYRFYQHYANMRVALIFLWLATVFDRGFDLRELVVLVCLLCVLVAASRNALRRYYERIADLLGT